jgi:hypothetical protein
MPCTKEWSLTRDLTDHLRIFIASAIITSGSCTTLKEIIPPRARESATNECMHDACACGPLVYLLSQHAS